MLFTYIKDFKPCNVQDADEKLSGLLGVQHLINSDNHPQEHFLIDRLTESHHCIMHLNIERVEVLVIWNKYTLINTFMFIN